MLQVAALESAISDKKQQVEQLVAEMKEANLQSLAIAPAEELKHLLEGEITLQYQTDFHCVVFNI